ncbi:peroxiredoxin [Hydrogenovibrio halophilus]|uniref:peroxiredoxin n=1 Tax=Hydrogenovibrio halophilus TaxID=373391 RepID=UPI0012FD4FDF|nr:peroxiredoxin [Hydrogenovibrio halophilus]
MLSRLRSNGLQPRTWLIALTGLLLWLPVSADTELAINQPAPDFRLPDQHNRMHQLADYRGQWLVLYFYPKNDTPGCTTEACSFRDNMNRLIQQNAAVLGISLDSQASHAAFAKKHRLPFSLLADEKGQVTKRYGALRDLIVMQFAKRMTFIIHPDGKLVKIYRKVNPATHVQQVLSDLKRLQAQTRNGKEA